LKYFIVLLKLFKECFKKLKPRSLYPLYFP